MALGTNTYYVLASNVLDVPIRTPLHADLLPVCDAQGNLDHYRVDRTKLADVSSLSSCLFESEVILERDKHFAVSADGPLRLVENQADYNGGTAYNHREAPQPCWILCRRMTVRRTTCRNGGYASWEQDVLRIH